MIKKQYMGISLAFVMAFILMNAPSSQAQIPYPYEYHQIHQGWQQGAYHANGARNYPRGARTWPSRFPGNGLRQPGYRPRYPQNSTAYPPKHRPPYYPQYPNQTPPPPQQQQSEDTGAYQNTAPASNTAPDEAGDAQQGQQDQYDPASQPPAQATRRHKKKSLLKRVEHFAEREIHPELRTLRQNAETYIDNQIQAQ
ncbi:MAG: hypothetical protein WCD79_01230 [Chthoniobacteraceae bacterium]